MPGEKKIFIAEDDQHFCELYQMALGTEGYEVKCANTGRDALDMIPQESPDLIILDVMMPEIDGYEVCRNLREMPQFALTPIIMLTALSTDDEKIKGYNVGADDYLTKPFPLKILKAKVRSLVERRSAPKIAPSDSVDSFPQPAFPVLEQQPEFPPQPVAPTPPTPVFEPPQPAAQPPQPAAQPPHPVAPTPPTPVFEPPQAVVTPTDPIFEPSPSQPEPPAPIEESPQPTVIREIVREDPPGAIPQHPDKTVRSGTTLPSTGTGVNPMALPFLGSIPRGTNILVSGPIGCGKSAFARLFLTQGLEQAERCMMICLDDDPSFVRKELSKKHPAVPTHESQNKMCFIDAYSCGGRTNSKERYAIKGALDLSDLSTLVTEAGATIGQSNQANAGGRRVIDSISSLFLNFDLPYVQRFLAFLARSGHFAGVSTIFVVEEGTLNERSLNNIKYIMDGVLEFRRDQNRFLARAQALKWAAASPDWSDITQAISE